MSLCLSVRLSVRLSGASLSRAVNLHLFRSDINQREIRALREHLERTRRAIREHSDNKSIKSESYSRSLKYCVLLVYDFPSHLPSELSSRHGGSLPLYFCSNTCLSPVSKPLNLERKEIRLKCYSNIPDAVLNPKLLQIGSSISARTEDKSWDQNVH